MPEMPTITHSSYNTAVVPFRDEYILGIPPQETGDVDYIIRRFNIEGTAPAMTQTVQMLQFAKEKIMAEVKNTTRVVQVYIADVTSEHVPLVDRILYKSEQFLTDSTNEELFFSIAIKDLLDKHNEKRSKIVNPDIKDRTEHLKPIRIRDLRMTVVQVATF